TSPATRTAPQCEPLAVALAVGHAHDALPRHAHQMVVNTNSSVGGVDVIPDHGQHLADARPGREHPDHQVVQVEPGLLARAKAAALLVGVPSAVLFQLLQEVISLVGFERLYLWCVSSTQ